MLFYRHEFNSISRDIAIYKDGRSNAKTLLIHDLKSAFGVLQARFQIIREPAQMWDISDLAIIMRTCIILHNMIVEDERDKYAQNWNDFD
jgi:hypothetical protein